MNPRVAADDFVASGASKEDLQGLARVPVETVHPAGPDAPAMERLGDEIAFTWSAHGVTASFGHLRESSDGIHGELSIVSGVLGEVHWGRLNLASTPAREGLVRKLEQAAGGLPWRAMLEMACRGAARDLRAGDPAAPLVPRLAAEGARYLVPKLLLQGETNTVFADGGSGKSLLALAVAVAIAGNIALPGGLRPASSCPALLLDWESCREEHEDRLARLLDGLGVPGHPPILYRAMSRALADDASKLRAEIARHRVGLVIVDSFAPACGAEPEGADAAIRAMNALRSFGAGVTRLVVAHVSKASAEQRSGPTKPFGSVFVQNISRSVWELRRAEDDGGDDLVIACFHRKVNTGRLFPPLGFRFVFHDEMTTLHAHDIGQRPELVKGATLGYRIRAALAGGALTAAEVAETIEAPEASVSAKLRYMSGKGHVIRLDPDAPSGRGRAARWGLPQPQ